MMSEILGYLKKKGFKKNGNVYKLELDEVEVSLDVETNMCLVDNGSVYASKLVKTLNDIESLFSICRYDLDFDFKATEDDVYNDRGESTYFPITPAWLAMSGFEKKGDHKWVQTQSDATVKYDTTNNRLSLIKGEEGFEGTVLTEDFARRIIYEVFND